LAKASRQAFRINEGCVGRVVCGDVETIGTSVAVLAPRPARTLSVEGKVPQFATAASKRRTRVGVKSVIAIVVAGVLILGWLAYVGWLVLKARSLKRISR
jgi:hypothetical protein